MALMDKGVGQKRHGRVFNVRRGPSLGLRTRSTIGFAVVTAIVTGAFAGVAYGRISGDVVSEREEVAMRQAHGNARIARSRLQGLEPDPGGVLASLESREGVPLLRFDGVWFAATVGAGLQDVPASLLEAVEEGKAARQRIRLGGELTVAVGTPIPAIDGQYFEFVPLKDVEFTLGAVRSALGLGALTATVLGGFLGAFASRRVLRPLRRVAAAATTVKGGDLSTHLEHTGDGDLDPLLDAFNDMVVELRERIERDARFTSNVTHELRGPLSTLNAACAVARRHADDPRQVRASLDELNKTVAAFNRLVVDLLDISRMEAGVAALNLEPVVTRSLIGAAVGDFDVAIDIGSDVPDVVVLDKRRIGQSLANLIENATRYGGGATTVSVRVQQDRLLMTVDDNGPGVPEHERSFIFERFARGDTAMDITGGTGLGLALVAEHMHLHGGSVEVTDSPGGGARFVLSIPLQAPA